MMSSADTPEQFRRASMAAMLAGVLALTSGLGLWFGLGGPLEGVRPAVLLVSHIITPSLAAAACVLRSRRASTRANRVAWTLLAVSAATWASASIVFGWYQLRDGGAPYPSLADGLYIGFAVPALGALGAFAWATPHAVSRARTVLDGLVVACSLLFISWVLVLGDLYRSSASELDAWVTSLAYPAFDVTVAAGVLALGLRQVSSRLSFMFVGAGLLLIAVSDSVYVHASLAGTFIVGHGSWQAGYTAGFLLVGVGALAFMPDAGASTPGAKTVSFPNHLGLGSQLIAYGPLVAAVLVGFVVTLDWDSDPVLLVLAAATLVVAGIREIFVLADAATLRSDLERLVDERTAELVGSQTRLRAITQTAADAIIVLDADTRVSTWNSGAVRLFGCTEEEAVGRPMSEFVAPHAREAHAEQLGGPDEGSGSEVAVIETAALRPDGTEVPVELSLSRWTHNGEDFTTGILRDITERRLAEEQSRLERAHIELFQRIAVAANEARGPEAALRDALALVSAYGDWNLGHAFLVDADAPDAPLLSMGWHTVGDDSFDAFVTACDAFVFDQHTGLPGQVIQTAGPVWLTPIGSRYDAPRLQLAARAGFTTYCGFPIRSRDMVVGALEFFSTAAVQPDPAVMELMNHVGTQLGRVVEREESERRLTRLALHDPLTGLSNRAVFHEHLEMFLAQARRRGSTAAVLLLDLDGFKEVNDSLGHAAGDALLVEVARRLADSTRAGDSVARLGGDEFAIGMGELTGPGQAEAHAVRILDLLMEPVLVENRRLRVAGSIGVALSETATTAQELLRNADLAMYRAKEEGKSRVAFFDPQMHRDVLNRLELEADLEQAVDAGQLRLVYQPIVEASTGRIRSREALVRWHHPERGVVPPGDFIPVAERSDLIERIGAWVLHRACRDAVAWRAAGDTDIAVSVNVSAREVRAGLIDVIRDTLETTGLPATSLVLEITESSIMEGSLIEAVCLLELHGLGVRLAVDDFGTGHSSLARLRSLPVQELKIDRSFAIDLPHDPAAAAMVEAVIAMARALGRDVVAEGVETAEQLEFLLSRGCDAIQGFLIGRPAPFEELGRQRDDISAGWKTLNTTANTSQTPDTAADLDDDTDLGRFALTVRSLLDRLQLATGLDSVYVTQIDWANNQQRVLIAHNTGELSIPEEALVDWSDTLSRQALLGSPCASADVLADFGPSQAASDLGIRSYVSVPIVRAENEVLGTLCGASTMPKPHTELTVGVMELFAQLLADQMPETSRPIAQDG